MRSPSHWNCRRDYHESLGLKHSQTKEKMRLPIMQLPNMGTEDGPEWKIAQEAVSRSKGLEWEAFKNCRSVEIYTDGSAPISNPGGPAGFAVVAVGYPGAINTAKSNRPEPCARIELGGYIPARKKEPATSNNRAEIAGALAAFELVRRLGEEGAPLEQVYVWSDSVYTVNCGNGTWQRKKNTDLWPAFDTVREGAVQATGGKISLSWVKGHANSLYNNAADELATKAAFNFDEAAHTRFRAAQVASGREMPGQAALARQGVVVEPGASVEEQEATGGPPKEDLAYEWAVKTDYVLMISTKMDGAAHGAGGAGSFTGTYRLIARDGRIHQGQVKRAGSFLPDEGEYMTLIAALTDLVARIRSDRRDPSPYSITVFSGRELMTKQLTGAYSVKSPILRPLYIQARDLLGNFDRAEVEWKRKGQI